MVKSFDYPFPLPRPHTGMPLGNGTFGALVWGGESTLRITLGRSDFWDHRGGMEWPEERTYASVCRCLEAGDEAGLRSLFYPSTPEPGVPKRPSVLPMGRWEIRFGEDSCLESVRMNLEKGEVIVSLGTPDGVQKLVLGLDREQPLLWITIPEGVNLRGVRAIPAWESVGKYLQSIGFSRPRSFERGSATGWIQERPADPPLCVMGEPAGPDYLLCAVYGDDPDRAVRNASELLERGEAEGVRELRRRNRAWWADFWQSTPTIDIPHPRFRVHWYFGMYKFGSFTNPTAPPVNLQGPWVEDYQMPPWDNDYHFNINVQMCYWPAYAGNCLERVDHLFERIESWEPILRDNARKFVGIRDGLLLPHANDDRGRNMGSFWTGAIDHGSTAWIAQMMYQRYRFSMDREFLEKRAYPFMVGAMRVYEEMLRRDGEAFFLPVGPSPEYGGDAFHAWGRNPSFQLACIHRLCGDLIEASTVLRTPPNPVWSEIRRNLPLASLCGPAGKETLALWENGPYAESHRHHSHLAGLYPFETLPRDGKWKGILVRTIEEWVTRGMGTWCAWSFPWASMIYSRLDHPGSAELMLNLWNDLFINEGGGPRFFPLYPGLVRGPYGKEEPYNTPEIMQLDSAMGAVAAVNEMLLHCRNGVHHVFPGIRRAWGNAFFDGMLADGAFSVSAGLDGGIVSGVQVRSHAGGVFQLANPWLPNLPKGAPAKARLPVITFQLKPGETASIGPGMDW